MIIMSQTTNESHIYKQNLASKNSCNLKMTILNSYLVILYYRLSVFQQLFYDELLS